MRQQTTIASVGGGAISKTAILEIMKIEMSPPDYDCQPPPYSEPWWTIIAPDFEAHFRLSNDCQREGRLLSIPRGVIRFCSAAFTIPFHSPSSSINICLYALSKNI